MKKHILNFMKRGLMASAGGPIVLAIIYAILGVNGVIDTLTPNEVLLGILTSALLAFISAGSSVLYEIERLPIISVALLQGLILYLDYILIYLVNGWLQSQLHIIAIFTVCFVVGYAIIWVIIYLSILASTKKLNQKLGK